MFRFPQWSFAIGMSLVLCTWAQAALVSHYRLEEGSGTQVFDSARAVNDAIVGPGVTWETSNLPPIDTTAALDFGGGNNRIQSSFAGIGGSNARTVAFWVKAPTGTVPNAGIVAWGDSGVNGEKWHVRLNDSGAAVNGTVGALRTEIQGGFVVANVALNDGLWHHVASVFGGDSMHDVLHYVDGALVGASGMGADIAVNTDISNANANSSPVLIGARNQTGTLNFFNGAVDDVRIYDQALTAAEIRALIVTVPEPATMSLLALGALGLLRRRREVLTV